VPRRGAKDKSVGHSNGFVPVFWIVPWFSPRFERTIPLAQRPPLRLFGCWRFDVQKQTLSHPPLHPSVWRRSFSHGVSVGSPSLDFWCLQPLVPPRKKILRPFILLSWVERYAVFALLLGTSLFFSSPAFGSSAQPLEVPHSLVVRLSADLNDRWFPPPDTHFFPLLLCPD